MLARPPGEYLDSATGLVTCTPAEPQRPRPNLITVRVTDNGTPALNDTRSFTVVVTELNSAPTLPAPPDQTISELSTLTVTNAASDTDLPANILTFSLLSGPPGVNLDSATGLLTWTPTEAQGPSIHSFPTRRSSYLTPALNDTRSFTV